MMVDRYFPILTLNEKRPCNNEREENFLPILKGLKYKWRCPWFHTVRSSIPRFNAFSSFGRILISLRLVLMFINVENVERSFKNERKAVNDPKVANLSPR